MNHAGSVPRPPPGVPTDQAPNRELIWSKNQNPRCDSLVLSRPGMMTDFFGPSCRANAMRGPRFEQTVFELQPQPLAAIELIAEEPIRLVPTRVASCNGGEPHKEPRLSASALCGLGIPRLEADLRFPPCNCVACRRRRSWAPEGIHQPRQAGSEGMRVRNVPDASGRKADPIGPIPLRVNTGTGTPVSDLRELILPRRC